MKYVLVDKYDNVVTAKEFKSDTNGDDIKTYFMKLKKINSEAFDSLWRVMTIERYHEISESFLRKPSSSDGEFGSWLDVEKS